jgi:citrate lyase subunit beta / citryl-CoA lyase
VTDARPRRSVLYMPASNVRAMEKARSLACDVVVLDLEDAVAPEAKAEARAQAVQAIGQGGFGGREVVLRVNGLDTPWGADDLAAAARARPDAVLAPKVSSAADARAYAAPLGADLPLWVMIETCAALFALGEIVRATTSLEALVVGANDLAKEMRCRLDLERAPLSAALSLTVAAGRMAGLAVLDAVYNDLEDAEGLARQCRQGVDFGFDGKTLIHPNQIAAANQTFSPAADELAWARTVAAAFDAPENAGKGVLRVEGRMVERLHLDQARRLIAVSEAIAAREA